MGIWSDKELELIELYKGLVDKYPSSAKDIHTYVREPWFEQKLFFMLDCITPGRNYFIFNYSPQSDYLIFNNNNKYLEPIHIYAHQVDVMPMTVYQLRELIKKKIKATYNIASLPPEVEKVVDEARIDPDLFTKDLAHFGRVWVEN